MTLFESAFRPATGEEIRDTFGADGGSIGPLGVSVDVIADEALREGQFVAGANRDGWHVRGVEAGRDYEPRFADIRQAGRGRRVPGVRWTRSPCSPRSRSATSSSSAPFTRTRSRPCTSTRTGRRRRSSWAATASGLAGVMAAIVEQHHDERGIVWPRSVAPYDVHIVCLPGLEEQAEALEQRLEAAGAAVLLDDRELRAGEKFADADLIGCPFASRSARRRSRTARWTCSCGRLGRSSGCSWKR